jgi:hypothetical protein
VPREEEQQVEVARVPQTGRLNDLCDHRVGWLNILDTVTPSGDGRRLRRRNTLEER